MHNMDHNMCKNIKYYLLAISTLIKYHVSMKSFKMFQYSPANMINKCAVLLFPFEVVSFYNTCILSTSVFQTLVFLLLIRNFWFPETFFKQQLGFYLFFNNFMVSSFIFCNMQVFQFHPLLCHIK